MIIYRRTFDGKKFVSKRIVCNILLIDYKSLSVITDRQICRSRRQLLSKDLSVGNYRWTDPSIMTMVARMNFSMDVVVDNPR